MNFTIISIIIITIFATILRLFFIHKTGGLWNDEYISWAIATTPFKSGFWEHVMSQCHMPLYYLYLKFITFVFGDSDLVLRLSTVLLGLCSLPAMYFVGREKDKRTGLYALLVTAFSSFLIYYSQEVRLYSLLFLMSALTLLFTLRLLKNATINNVIGFIIFNVLVLFTHTIGFVYVFFNLLLVSILMFKRYKNLFIKIYLALGVSFLAMLPLILKIFTTVSFSQWWAKFSVKQVLILFSDYFSPVLLSLLDSLFVSSTVNVICLIVPTLIAIGCILFAVIKGDKIKQGLFALSILTIFVMILAALMGKLVFTSKYAIELYPVLIYLMVVGLSDIKSTWLRRTVLAVFMSIQILYFITPNYVAKLDRYEGHRIPVELIKHAKLQKGDYIILTYYPKERFEKYFDFSPYNVTSIHKGNFNEYYLPEVSYVEVVKTGKDLYLPIFSDAGRGEMTKKLDSTIFSKLHKGEKVVCIFLDSVSFVDKTLFERVIVDDKAYKRAPLLFLVFSDVKNYLVDEAKFNQFTSVKYEKIGAWSAVTFEK